MAEPTRYRIAPNVAWLDAAEVEPDRDTVWAAVLPDGRPVVLDGSACAVWRALAEHGTVTAIAEQLTPPDDPDLLATVAQDVRAFLGGLVAQGLVVADEDARR